MSRAPAARALAARRRAYAVELRAMRKTFQQIADATLPCPEHYAMGGMDPARCAELHAFARQVGEDDGLYPIDCQRMYANRKGAQRAVEEGLAKSYLIGEADRDTLRREQLASADVVLAAMIRDLTAPDLATVLAAHQWQPSCECSCGQPVVDVDAHEDHVARVVKASRITDPEDRARAGRVALQALGRIARVTGTDAPTRVVFTEELDQELEQALADLRDTPAPDAAALRE